MRIILTVLAALMSLSASGQDTIIAEGVIDAPVRQVWNAWATSEGLRSWLAPLAEIDARIGGLMRANYDAKGTLGDAETIENRVLSLEPERMLSIQVAKAPETFPFRARVGEMWTILYLSPASRNRTHLRIVGLGFESDNEAQQMKEFFKRGNAFTLKQLQEHFASPDRASKP